MIMSYKYSVIIPVYKAQDTLKRCVDSLLIQNCADAEIILVNDGSPDDCGKICEEYAAKYANIKYIAKENGGVSSARNAGLDAASGIYIMFVDSDDYVADTYFAEIDKALAEYDWDYILFSTYKTDGKTVTESHFASYSVKTKSEIAERIVVEINRSTINGPVTKVYKRELLERHSIRFNEKLSIAEDWSFNVRYALNAGSMCRIECPLYYVSTENENSLSRRIIADYYEQHTASVNDVREAIDNCAFCDEERKPIVETINFGEYRAIYTNAKIQHKKKMCLRERIKNIRAMCKAVNSEKYQIPKTWYCRLISLPVRLNLALVIDTIAWKLTRR